jgi:hypothetical protein
VRKQAYVVSENDSQLPHLILHINRIQPGITNNNIKRICRYANESKTQRLPPMGGAGNLLRTPVLSLAQGTSRAM